mmetsp:Transcript_111624/g.279553  ORF Transcript_111624/g.279553 Transcript_111624/m.279553 type:complete len:97 (+) Transcript_111624:1354-1644(+)
MVAAAAEMATSGDEALDPDGPRPVTEAPQHALLPEEDIDQHSQDLDEAAAAAASAPPRGLLLPPVPAAAEADDWPTSGVASGPPSVAEGGSAPKAP